MKPLRKAFLILILLFTGLIAKAQSPAENSQKLVNEGIALHDEKKYAEAMEKYIQAIKADTNNAKAYYEMGYILYISGKPKDAIPYMEKVLIIDPKAGGAYDVLGSIYDDDHQPDKAIELYKKGIDADPEYQRLPFNLGIAYYRTKKYEEAETYAISSIKHDPKHASSMRLYAMATYWNKKRHCSLLAWCSFIIMEPNTARSAEAYKYIKSILNYGITRTDEKNVKMTLSPDEVGSGGMIMALASIAATENKKGLTSTDSLNLQLQAILKISANIAVSKQTPFYTNYLAKYFTKLANSDNMPAFSHLVCLTANKDESQTWFKEHPRELDELNKWAQITERSF